MIIDDFIQYEQEKRLFEIEVRGFKYWHYIRKVVYDNILEQNNHIGQAHTNLKSEPYYKRVTLKLFQMKNWFFKNPLYFLKEKDILVFNHPRRVMNGEYYECIYTDDLLNELTNSYYVYEQPLLEKHFSPVRTKNLRYLDYLNFKVAIKVEIKRKIIGFDFTEKEKEKIISIVKEVGNFFETRLSEEIILKSLEIAYLVYTASRKYYNTIIDKIKPKIIIEVVSYGRDKYIINELSKEKGIPVIEFQHGTMGKYHVAYNIKEEKISTFPDYVFIFGQFWKDNTCLPIDDSRIKVVGWPYFEKKVNEFKQKIKMKDDFKKTILFVSQGTIGKELSQIAVDISNILDKNEYNIIYKLHPGEYARWKKDYSWLIDANLQVVDNNRKDMHYYFAQSDFQVGVASTALFEGLGYELKTIIVKLTGFEYTEELFNNSLAELAENAEDIIRILKNDNHCEKKCDVNYFWESYSLQKMVSEIEKIIKTSEQ